MKKNLCIVFTTLPSEEDAKEFAEKLVASRIVECAKVFPTSSFYVWENKLVKDHEGIIIAKVRQEKVNDLENFFMSNHPYSIPEFCVVDCSYVGEKYLEWAYTDKSIVE
ncbi:MAG: divalent-cation tolerance protein CutA [Deltaproteobacteria bacterium]|nr:divalent-cation tolerance protein CutA [Deltaproteobacteria bacterium]MCX7952102.1 divalent-cation tolerance protein CutA [Deltaproteobacteria bacterium]